MTLVASAHTELRRRLGRELAGRARFGWLMHLVFLALFASESNFGTENSTAVWIYCLVVAVSGLGRTWCAMRVLKLKDACAQRWLTGLQYSIYFHSVCWGAFLSFAFWKVYGNHTLETALLISVGGFTAIGASVLASYPAIAAVYVAAQVGPDLVWAVFARSQLGILPLFLGLVFVAFLSGIVLIQHRYTISALEAQILLEAQSAELRAAKEAAEQASSARARFLANMSHEIRTPINGILGLAQLMGDSPLSAEQRPMLQALFRSAEDLLALVDDILDFSKMRVGKMTIEHLPFDLNMLVRDVVAPMVPIATAKGVHCRIELAPSLSGSFRGDPLRIRQVLRNLLNNAIKFTPAGEIRLTVQPRRPGWVQFTVIDTGIGIAPDKLPNLFQDFAQGDSSTTRRFGGSGLGLAISKNLADLMKGSLTVESLVGSGSRFHFEIPLPACEPGSPALEASEKALKGGNPRLPPGLRILIAEDNAINRMITERFLAGAGATVDLAETGKQAVALFDAREYDVILMDCHMPEMDGFEAAAAIRSQGDSGLAVPIIAVTASVLDEDRQRCIEARMSGLVSKPLRREALVETILAALAGPEPAPFRLKVP